MQQLPFSPDDDDELEDAFHRIFIYRIHSVIENFLSSTSPLTGFK
jgi:hypothetical protein